MKEQVVMLSKKRKDVYLLTMNHLTEKLLSQMVQLMNQKMAAYETQWLFFLMRVIDLAASRMLERCNKLKRLRRASLNKKNRKDLKKKGKG